MARYLSDEWFDELQRAAAASDTLRAATTDLSLTVQHTITDGPDGTRTFHVSLDNGTVQVAEGDEPNADVTFTQKYDTAAAIARGELSAQLAFMTGKLRVGGNLPALVERQRALQSLDDVFAGVRAATEF